MSAVADASEVLGFVRSRQRARGRRKDFFDQLYQYYVGMLFIGALGLLVYRGLQQSALESAPAAALIDGLQRWMPVALFALLTGVVRTATVRGPVAFGRADVAWLFASPLPRSPLVRPRLIAGLSIGVIAGASLGAATAVVTGGPLDVSIPALIGASAGAMGALGLLAAALAWEVERSPWATEVMFRWGWVLLAGVVALGTLGAVVPSAAPSLLWSGPWGWASAPTIHAAGGKASSWALQLALLCGAAVAAASRALATADRVQFDELERRAELKAGLAAATYTLDLRGLSLMQRRARREVLGVRRTRVPRPRHPLLAIPWRDALFFVRSPGRVVVAMGLVAGSVVAASWGQDQILVLVFATLLVYVAAGRLIEPMRIESDDGDASRRLPWRFGDIAILHGIVPVALMTIAGLLGVGVAAGLGHLEGPAVWAALLMVPLLAVTFVATALRMAGRGRVPIELLYQGPEFMILWLIAGPALIAISIGLPAIYFVVQAKNSDLVTELLPQALLVGAAVAGGTAWSLRVQQPPD